MSNYSAILGGVTARPKSDPEPFFDSLQQSLAAQKLTATWLKAGPAALAGISNSCRSKASEGGEVDPAVCSVSVGEIFNLQELALELSGSCRRYPEEDDFLVDGYRRWDENLLARLDGAFAAALWDQRKCKLILFCDRRSDVSLYYRVNADGIVFSSSLSLLAGQGAEIDRQAAKEFLRFLYIAPPRTIYANIQRLEPGHYLAVEHGRAVLQKLPSPLPSWSSINLNRMAEDEVVGTFDDLLKDSARRRVSGRRVGMLLSSGIDSATLAAVCQNFASEIIAYTVSFGDRESDEGDQARDLARQLGIAHETVNFQYPDYLRAFDQMISGFEQPLGDPASLPLIPACGLAVDRADVLIDGTGADGLFSSVMPRYLRFVFEFSARLPKPMRQSAERTSTFLETYGITKFAGLFDFDEPEELLITWRGWQRKELKSLFGEEIDFGESAFYRTVRDAEPDGAQAIYDAVAVFPPDDCRLASAELCGLPMYFPYHDVQVEEFIRALPRHWRYRKEESKVTLRRLYKNYFPERFWQTKKKYFTFPLQEFLARDDYRLVREHLSPSRLHSASLIATDRASPWIDRYVSGDDSLVFKVWSLLVLHAWVHGRPGNAVAN